MYNKPIDGNILVTGGSGYLGTHLVQTLLDKYDDVKVRAVSRNENEIARLKWICDSNRLDPIVGDIRDDSVQKFILRDVDCLIHLAAMKHIVLCEMHPSEAIEVNVVATMNLLEYFEGQTFIGMSTDKGLWPWGCYGATKLLMEKMILHKGKHDESRRYMIVRSGNIFASSGSVIETWKYQIEDANEIMVTDPEMTRFFISVDDVTQFIIKVMEEGSNGNLYIPQHKAIVLRDLANAFIAFFGNENTKIKIIGFRHTEKLHEDLFATYENVLTELKESSSQFAQKMDMKEITDLLKASMKWHH